MSEAGGGAAPSGRERIDRRVERGTAASPVPEESTPAPGSCRVLRNEGTQHFGCSNRIRRVDECLGLDE